MFKGLLILNSGPPRSEQLLLLVMAAVLKSERDPFMTGMCQINVLSLAAAL